MHRHAMTLSNLMTLGMKPCPWWVNGSVASKESFCQLDKLICTRARVSHGRAAKVVSSTLSSRSGSCELPVCHDGMGQGKKSRLVDVFFLVGNTTLYLI